VYIALTLKKTSSSFLYMAKVLLLLLPLLVQSMTVVLPYATEYSKSQSLRISGPPPQSHSKVKLVPLEDER
jgi:hypothetical protein